jgi:hypothetical protein
VTKAEAKQWFIDTQGGTILNWMAWLTERLESVTIKAFAKTDNFPLDEWSVQLFTNPAWTPHTLTLVVNVIVKPINTKTFALSNIGLSPWQAVLRHGPIPSLISLNINTRLSA